MKTILVQFIAETIKKINEIRLDDGAGDDKNWLMF